MKTSVCPAKEIKRTKKVGEKESEERKCPKMEIVCHMKMIQQHASIKLNKFNGELKKNCEQDTRAGLNLKLPFQWNKGRWYIFRNW